MIINNVKKYRLKNNNFANVKCFKYYKKSYYESNYFNFKKKEKKTNRNDISRLENSYKAFNKFIIYFLKRKNKVAIVTKNKNNNLKNISRKKRIEIIIYRK